MIDTTSDVETIVNHIYQEKSGEEKLLIALKMFETSREIVLSSLGKNLQEKEIRKQLFLRFYKSEFENTKLEEIMSKL